MNLLWVSCLDPRLSSCGHLSSYEKLQAKNILIWEASNLNLGENTNSNNNSNDNNESQKESNDDGIFSFSEMMVIEKDRKPVSTVTEANTEVEHYLSNIVHVNEKTDALIWWREHASMHP